jgi:glycosyltransferase involved in cell wall biosynthesis
MNDSHPVVGAAVPAPGMSPPRRLRIAEVMECTIGGTRRHIRELCRGIAERGHAVTLFASAERDATFRDDLAALTAGGVAVVELPMLRQIAPRRDLEHFGALRRAFAAGRFDVVHTHSSKAGALGRTAARVAARGAALVHTPHTFAFNFSEQFSPRKRRMFLAIERRLGRVTDRMIHVSASERREGAELRVIDPRRQVVIPNGIDPAPHRAARLAGGAAVRDELGIGGAPLIGAVGLLNEAKGHLDLIAALALVRRDVPDAVCVIAGEGALRRALEAKAHELGLASAVRLVGHRRDVPAILAALDVFAMPSLWEGMPYALLEAMATSLPAVVSDVNGCRDVVETGRTGLLVPPRDPAALAAALVALLRDPERRVAMGRAAAACVDAEYTLDVMIDRHVKLFEDVAAQRAAARQRS